MFVELPFWVFWLNARRWADPSSVQLDVASTRPARFRYPTWFIALWGVV